MPRAPLPVPTPPDCRDTLGLSPAALAKRNLNDGITWCPKPPYPEYDRYCDPKNPKTILYKHVKKANETLKSIVPATPLLKSTMCEKFDMALYFKVETRHTTGSFHERSAIYVLRKLSSEQRKAGVFTASVGNWAVALAHQGHLLKTPVTVVLPTTTCSFVVNQCQDYGATVVLCGKDIAEAKTYAFKLIADQGHLGTYLNGYDHPNVIAGAGCIGIEILEQLPETDAILVPIGGGGLIAGIAAVVKHIKPAVLLYGVEAGKSCSFAKALDNERPYRTAAERSLAASLTVPKAGDNAFHTARSLIDKLILVHDDWIARAILHLIEEESIVAEGAGAISLSALMCIPNILPELHGKKVVCVVSGGNIELWHIHRAILHGKAAEGRIFTMAIRVEPGKDIIRNNILKVIKYMQCNIMYSGVEKEWLEANKLLDTYEDYDEYCDPECPKIIKYDDVVEAAHRLRPYILNTPIMAAKTQQEFGIGVHYKLEFMQKSGSFKERGSLNALQLLPTDKKKIGVVIASTGNEAISMCYHAAKMSIPVIVVMPVNLAIDKMQTCHEYGAKVIVQGANLVESQKYARALARDKGLTYINGRDHPHILAGYGTLALEIMETMPSLDALIVPVGTGGLAAAMATVIKHVKPSVLIYGVQPELTPTFFSSLENDEPVTLPIQNNVADAVTVSAVGCNAFSTAKPLLDRMLLVKEDWITRAMLHLVEREKFIVEGAGACTLAAIIGNLVPELKTKNVVCLLTGGNADNVMLVRCLERGLAAEGRLVKFWVGIRNDAISKSKLVSLIAAGGYNIHRHFQDNSWTDGAQHFVEMKIVCETKGLAHALELKRIIEKAYPLTSIFENEPFNDKRTCPCYIKKIT